MASKIDVQSGESITVSDSFATYTRSEFEKTSKGLALGSSQWQREPMAAGVSTTQMYIPLAASSVSIS